MKRTVDDFIQPFSWSDLSADTRNARTPSDQLVVTKIRRTHLRNSGLTNNQFLTPLLAFAVSLLISITTSGQEPAATATSGTVASAVVEKKFEFAATTTTSSKSFEKLNLFSKRSPGEFVVPSPQSSDDEEMHIEIRPYVWLAGIYGTLRVENRTASTGSGTDSGSLLGMLDFAAAAQVEVSKGRWRLILDENYVNLGTTGTGPLGLVTIGVQPTMNIFEFGGSYTFASIPNDKATSADPLPPVLTAEVLGGGRWFHLGLGLEPENADPVEGSRNLLGAFIGNRVKVSPHPAITLIGKYTVGTAGVGSNFAWSADALADFRWKKGFSIGGGYRWLGLNADDGSNRVGFDGTLRGLVLSLTLYR